MQLDDRAREALELYTVEIQAVAIANGVDPCVVAAIMWRESIFGLACRPPGPAGTGDGGHGRGLMQIDDRWHEFARTGSWPNPLENIKYAIEQVLVPALNLFRRQPGATDANVLHWALSAYNCGPGRALGAVNRDIDPDAYTTGKNYARDVLARAEVIRAAGVFIDIDRIAGDVWPGGEAA